MSQQKVNMFYQAILEGIKDTFFFQQIKEPTRYREGDIPSLLDLVFNNENMMKICNICQNLERVITKF